MISGLYNHLCHFRDSVKDVVSRLFLQPALAALQNLGRFFLFPASWGARKVEVLKPSSLEDSPPAGPSSEESSVSELRSAVSIESLQSIPDDSGVIFSDQLPIPRPLPNFGHSCYLATVAQMWLLHYEEILRQLEPKNEQVQKLIQFIDGYKSGTADLFLLLEVYYAQSARFRGELPNGIKTIEWMRQNPEIAATQHRCQDPLDVIYCFAELIGAPAPILPHAEHLKRYDQDVITFERPVGGVVEEVRVLPQGTYRLCALGMGRGQAHHWGYVRRQGNWYYVDDASIKPKTTEETFKYSHQASMLVYERISN